MIVISKYEINRVKWFKLSVFTYGRFCASCIYVFDIGSDESEFLTHSQFKYNLFTLRTINILTCTHCQFKVFTYFQVLYTNIDQKFVNSLHGLLHYEIGGLYCHLIRTFVHCIHMGHLFCNGLVHVIYSVVSCQYSYTILGLLFT